MEGDSGFRPWDELIPDTLGLIFINLDAQEILQVIPLVCKSWCKVVEGPYCWQWIDTGHLLHDTQLEKVKVEQLLRALIPRSAGSLRELCVSSIDDHILPFIAEHARSLQTLEIVDSRITNSGFEQFLKKSTSLSTLVLRNCWHLNKDAVEAIKRNCKRLVSLTWESHPLLYLGHPRDDEDECIMPNLKRLSIRYALIEDSFVLGLLSCCPELEWAQIRGVYGLTLDPTAVREKYPNIVTLDMGNDTVSDSDCSTGWGDVDLYDEYYYGSDDDLDYVDYEYDDINDYGGSYSYE